MYIHVEDLNKTPKSICKLRRMGKLKKSIEKGDLVNVDFKNKKVVETPKQPPQPQQPPKVKQPTTSSLGVNQAKRDQNYRNMLKLREEFDKAKKDNGVKKLNIKYEPEVRQTTTEKGPNFKPQKVKWADGVNSDGDVKLQRLN